MSVTVEEMAAYLRRRDEERRARAEARAMRLLALLPEARRILVEDHGASRVLLFGSLASGDPNEGSDVDLAVEGLAGARYFHALADLMRLFEAAVDLVRLEEASPSVGERVRSEGREL